MGCLLLCIAVIDMRVRPRVTRFLEPIGKGLSSLGVTPTFMTAFGLVIVITGSILIANGFLKSGAIVVLCGAILDGLDGSVARAGGTESPRGAFLDAAFDRIGEIAAFAGLGVANAGDERVLLLLVLAMGGAMLVPYLRAKAEAEGFNGKGGLMGRAERVLIFTIGLMFGVVEPMLWVLVISVWLTAVMRFVDTYRSFE
ncbi:MAG: CDP-alcohol phosphatidyltransferase family protein [Acidimicrobiia bacterium]